MYIYSHILIYFYAMYLWWLRDMIETDILICVFGWMYALWFQRLLLLRHLSRLLAKTILFYIKEKPRISNWQSQWMVFEVLDFQGIHIYTWHAIYIYIYTCVFIGIVWDWTLAFVLRLCWWKCRLTACSGQRKTIPRHRICPSPLEWTRTIREFRTASTCCKLRS